MAGEIVKTEGICLAILPWSRTSHIVRWMSPEGIVTTVVKGAERPKSLFLGAYDLNYTCEVLYYAHGKRDLHPLREASPLCLREKLRADFRALALAGYFRLMVGSLAPMGTEARAWFDLLARSLDGLAANVQPNLVRLLVDFDLNVLSLAGLSPDFSGYDPQAPWSAFDLETGAFASEGGKRLIRIARETAVFLEKQEIDEKKVQIPLDAARVIGVFYHFHLDSVSESRRLTLKLIAQ